jgi:acetylornithine deacetylase/succinyl-diaminopimelate desuccinylase-like protein
VDEFVLASGTTYYERLLLEPTCTVNGLRAGYGGEGTKTIIPHRATAKLDFRLVPDQDPETVLERVREHFRRVDPAIEVTAHSSFPPMKTPLDTPAADTVAAALESAWGEEPVELPLLGGSLPAAHFREALDVPVLVVPYANPDQGNHSPNEHLDLDCLHNGVRTSAGVLRSFAGTTD